MSRRRRRVVRGVFQRPQRKPLQPRSRLSRAGGAAGLLLRRVAARGVHGRVAQSGVSHIQGR